MQQAWNDFNIGDDNVKARMIGRIVGEVALAVVGTKGATATLDAMKTSAKSGSLGAKLGKIGRGERTADELVVGLEATAEAIELIPTQFREMVLRAFKGAPEARTLTSDITVYRHWGGIAGETGSPWYSFERYTPAEARAKLALPDGNTAVYVTEFKVPAGTKIVQGDAASMVGETGFGDYAVEGAKLIYLPDPSIAQIIH